MANGVAQIRRSVMTLALPVTVSSLLQRTEGIVAVFLVGGLGAIPIAAVGLGQLLAFIATTLVSGLSVGTNVIIAQQWGARRY
ncbi:MAG TPA: MATE family efflux transporter, partial [Nitrospira sp.]|nr:MATE family efflux transporter [Nitrospira sp.]